MGDECGAPDLQELIYEVLREVGLKVYDSSELEPGP